MCIDVAVILYIDIVVFILCIDEVVILYIDIVVFILCIDELLVSISGIFEVENCVTQTDSMYVWHVIINWRIRYLDNRKELKIQRSNICQNKENYCLRQCNTFII